MKVNDRIHGFTVREVRELPEIKATMVRMEYEKNGADLVWLDRADENKTFAITFKTIPENDTGVFHILEHSVLNGSKKYPVKEPFVELLKSSLQTFLNAFTFPDKTMYPVCSRNDQDFLNLMDVYLDAVLHPLSIEDPHAFLQEGWHYEPEGDALRLNGVVFNEMKGAYSDPDTVLQDALCRQLFPDNCYRWSSGGHPEHIPALSYEQYLACHAKFYHPSNARIFLDGAVDLDAVLGKLDEFLCEYERLNIDEEIPMQCPVSPGEQTAYYAVSSEDDLCGKVILGEGWVYGSFDEQEKLIGCSALTELLCGSNEAPLTKALLDAELCEDVSFMPMDGIQQLSALLVVHNAEEENIDRIWETVERTLQETAAEGLDRERLASILSRMEFQAREKDFDGMPRGLVYGMTVMESWLYGGDPAQKLCADSLYQTLRDKIGSGWFEALLSEVFLHNPHHARVRLLPSVTCAEEAAQRESARLREIRSGMTDEAFRQTAEQFRRLRERQNTPDTVEQLASLPLLSLSDIPERGIDFPGKAKKIDGITVLHHPLDTDGILHLNLYFSLADLPQDEISKLSFFSSLPGDLATEHYDALRLHSEMDAQLGRFALSPAAYARSGDTESAVPYLMLSVSMLESKKDTAVSVLDEILNRTDYSDREQILNLLRQNRFGMEQSIQQAGNQFGAMRLGAACTVQRALEEQLRGIRMFRWLQDTEKQFDKQWDALRDTFAEWGRTLFSRRRVTVGITGEMDEQWISRLLSVFPDVPVGKPAAYRKSAPASEGFVIPAEIGYAAKSANLYGIGAAYAGISKVASQLLTYDYLWNTVRVKGGAYGTGLSVRPDGQVSITSYRDPSPAASLSVFDGCGDALRSFCESNECLDKYIISTIAATEPLMTPRMQGIVTENLRFTGRSSEDLQRIRSEILHATKAELAAFADTLDRITDTSSACMIGGKALVTAMDRVENL